MCIHAQNLESRQKFCLKILEKERETNKDTLLVVESNIMGGSNNTHATLLNILFLGRWRRISFSYISKILSTDRVQTALPKGATCKPRLVVTISHCMCNIINFCKNFWKRSFVKSAKWLFQHNKTDLYDLLKGGFSNFVQQINYYTNTSVGY